MGFIANWLVTAIATMVAIWLVPGIEIIGGAYAGPILFALVLSLLNSVVRPILKVLSIPINILTLGLFTFVLNAIMLQLASYVSFNVFYQGVYIWSFESALVASVIISVVSSVLGAVVRG